MTLWRCRIAVAAFAGVLAGVPHTILAQSAPVAATLPAIFAPPLGQRLDYRVTSRRLARDGSFILFTLHYDLIWERIGRGFGLNATLQRISSDAPPSVSGAMTGLMQPLIGLPVGYLVAPDGSRVELVEPDTLWARIGPPAARAGQGAGAAQADSMAAVLLSLPLEQRNKLLSADIRALVARANPDIVGAARTDRGPDQSAVRQQGADVIVTSRITLGKLAADGPMHGARLSIMSNWTVDGRTGLVTSATIQHWLRDDGAAAPTLVEERTSVLNLAPA